MTGILCLDKPAGMTSFACCAALRRLTGEKRIGHAGTLDPMATGVLPLMLGRATRAIPLLPTHDKAYRATVRFGFTSDTQDIWGEVVPTGRPLPAREAVEAALPAFRGTIQQIPPMVSACKQKGERLYALARRGITVERPPRPVSIYELTAEQYDRTAGEVTLYCRCSAGTYIRTLAADLGDSLGCGAVLTALRRTEASGFPLADCLTLEECESLAAAGALADRVLPVDAVFATYPVIAVTAAQAARFTNGGSLAQDRLGGQTVSGTVRVASPDGTFLGLGTPRPDGELHPLRLFSER